MSKFEKFRTYFEGKTVLVTGGAGFIGSNLSRALIEIGANVRVVDNLITGHLSNIADLLGEKLEFIEADIRDFKVCEKAMAGVDFISHQAALGSVPRSMNEPLVSHDHNVNGTINILWAAYNANIKRVVMASSSSVYGDEETLPKTEERTGNLLSPYAATKGIGELYANTMNQAFGLEVVALRYFNIYGPRQDPEGPYAAVIPKFIQMFQEGVSPIVYGDGQQSRDFTHVNNAIFANMAAMCNPDISGFNAINIACGARLTVNQLIHEIKAAVNSFGIETRGIEPTYADERPGDIRHSHANIEKAEEILDYRVLMDVSEGIHNTVAWFIDENCGQ